MTTEDKSSLHFLVVDDDAASRTTIAEYLRSLGYERITVARDGTEGMRFLDRDATINFIISDWDMPLLDGLGLLQRVKFNPTRAHLPFMIVTSPVSEEAEKVVLAAGNMVDGYLIKPFRSAALKEKIDKILSLTVRGPQRQVICVDDDPDARQTVVEYLKQLGYKDIQEFGDGRAGLNYLLANIDRVGLIVSDWEMPEMTGIQFLQSCKSHPKLQEIPFLMITSQTSVEKMKVMQAAKSNVDQYLLKPFRADDLRKKVEDLLEKSRSFGDIRKLTLEAVEHLEHGRYPAAQQKFEEVLKLNPENDIALRGMGDVQLKVKGVQASLPFYRRAVEANPVNAKGYQKLASAYEQVGWADKAIALLQTGISQISFNGDLHFQLGVLYNKKDWTEQAKAEFEKTLELQLDHQEARLMLEMLSGGTRKD